MTERKIEGVPDGWRLVRIGVPRPGVDWVINHEQSPAIYEYETSCENWPIIEKIEQPKRYRPFANAAEFEPHRDRWWRVREESEFYQRTTYYSDDFNSGQDWKTCFDERVFDDGSPFGVEVTE